MKPRHLAIGALLIAVLATVVLLFTGQRVLVHEHKVSPGDSYVVPDHGNLGDANQQSLVCRYFTGRSVVTTVFWYSSNNVLGKDQCPIFTKQSD